ncbi:hypothetical protein IFM89_018888 [Coptis chinensis]|uniref:Uncharacterized protein n=1 Tax=Coptis chinensis TaxID=261450 RepID=A0A835LM12_9MAGN|nr:hypothetical protein IFM89_018888 [Coptis chinensis]
MKQYQGEYYNLTIGLYSFKAIFLINFGVNNKSSDGTRLSLTTIIGVVFGFIVGISFPSLLVIPSLPDGDLYAPKVPDMVRLHWKSRGSKKRSLAIVDYGHDEIAMFLEPEAEVSEIMSSGQWACDETSTILIIEEDDSILIEEERVLSPSPLPQIPISSPLLQPQTTLEVHRSKKRYLAIVDYGHYETAMSLEPEAEESEIMSSGQWACDGWGGY